MPDTIMQLDEFSQAYASQAKRFMWFLGAGASRNAGMPTADDLIWELRLRLYCAAERQDIQSHDLANKALRERIESYFESKGAPVRWAADEYTYFFEAAFGTDYAAQQRFLQDELNSSKISLNIGNRILAALLSMQAANIVFSTNFDDVLEQAVATVAGKSIAAFHLEGSYAALDAINSDQFPVYAKLHGDFRYRSLKNLSQDLKDNDAEIQRAFLAASNRFGIIVTGYSGRDANVMRMFHEAVGQANPFPAGLYWAVTRPSDVADSVRELITAARAAGVSAAIVEVGTFDILLATLWRQVRDKPAALIEKVQPYRAGAITIPLPPPGNDYPVLRSNALPIKDLPTKCGVIQCNPPMTYARLRDAQGDKIPDSAIAVTGEVFYWGSSAEVRSFIKQDEISSEHEHTFPDPGAALNTSTVMKGFFEQGLAHALCERAPVVLRKRGRAYYAVISTKPEDRAKLNRLAKAVGGNERAYISGQVPSVQAQWAEAVTIRLEERAGAWYFLLEPAIWISPLSMREQAAGFLRTRVLKRYNRQANDILDAWIAILLGDSTTSSEVTVDAFADGDHSAKFKITKRTAYSGRAVTRVR